MNYRNILQHVKENGGVSYSTTYGNLAGKRGYAVSPYKERELKIPYSELSENVLLGYVSENSDLLSSDDHFLGIWVENDTAFLDISVRVPFKKDAAKLAIGNSQLAYFDLKNLETIWI